MLEVRESSLYPGLQRLLLKGRVKAECGANHRRARYHALTATGRKRMAVEREEFDRVILAIHTVLDDLDHARSYQTSVAPAAMVTHRG